jgi:hypothetical protein
MAISDDRRDISENAALRESKSASRLSALDFIWSENQLHSMSCERDSYRCNGIAGGNKLVMMVVYERLPFAI